ncbi:MAG TPA: 6,7-dimethyl-8-ribityllumazine synthase [Bdellovibrionales bacterium]|nr:6,7-dimethyl-8-ribityllumazine synthase [Bdellovibrionales bacterium]
MFIQGQMKPKDRWKIGIVTARFNSEITERLEDGCFQRLLELGVKPGQIIRVRVPGAVEIPIAAAKLIQRECDGVIALGCVIQGDTKHFDYVCNAVERGCTQVMLETKKPVIFGVLTTDNDEQAQARVGGAHGHKGRDAADTAIEMLSLMELI